MKLEQDQDFTKRPFGVVSQQRSEGNLRQRKSILENKPGFSSVASGTSGSSSAGTSGSSTSPWDSLEDGDQRQTKKRKDCSAFCPRRHWCHHASFSFRYTNASSSWVRAEKESTHSQRRWFDRPEWGPPAQPAQHLRLLVIKSQRASRLFAAETPQTVLYWRSEFRNDREVKQRDSDPTTLYFRDNLQPDTYFPIFPKCNLFVWKSETELPENWALTFILE